MLKKTNILALVGGGILPKFSRNKITIYDAHEGLILSQIRFNSGVLSVKLRTDSIIGAIEDKIYIFNINTLQTIDIIEIDKIRHPIYGISNSNKGLVIGFPEFKKKGNVQIEKYFILKNKYKKEEKKIINAHESNITFITINNEGTLLATGSEKGAYIHLYEISNYNLIAELRRGKKPNIAYMSFEFNSDIFGYSGDNGKNYFYDISKIKNVINFINYEKSKQENETEEKDNKKDMPNKFEIINKIRIKRFIKIKIKETKNILGFVKPKCIIILSSNGKFQKFSYNVVNTENFQEIEESFIKTNDI